MAELEDLQAQHRKELRDLQARITQKKKSATKKTRRGVNSECDELERQLKERHEREMAAMNGMPDETNDDGMLDPVDLDLPDSVAQDAAQPLSDSIQHLTISGDGANEEKPKKRNRQKERLARRAAEQEAAAVAAETEAASMPNWKRQERTAMLKAFDEYKLTEEEIQPDGHCLFSSVADQLAQTGIPLSVPGGPEHPRYKAVRHAAARYMEAHPDEFAGFLDEPLDSYVSKIRDTAEWGGQLELMAVARTYNVEVCVLQEGRLERIKPSEDGDTLEKLWLAYYRHGYGLGEHYNSLRRKT